MAPVYKVFANPDELTDEEKAAIQAAKESLGVSKILKKLYALVAMSGFGVVLGLLTLLLLTAYLLRKCIKHRRQKELGTGGQPAPMAGAAAPMGPV